MYGYSRYISLEYNILNGTPDPIIKLILIYINNEDNTHFTQWIKLNNKILRVFCNKCRNPQSCREKRKKKLLRCKYKDIKNENIYYSYYDAGWIEKECNNYDVLDYCVNHFCIICNIKFMFGGNIKLYSLKYANGKYRIELKNNTNYDIFICAKCVDKISKERKQKIQSQQPYIL